MNEMLRKMLIRHEGLELKPYRDFGGKLTIGVGRNLDDLGVSYDEALFLLDHDINRVSQQVRDAFQWFNDLDEPRRVVILNMVFNLGIAGFKKFKLMIRAIEVHDYKLASIEMLSSQWAAQVGRRARELSTIMLTGQYQESFN